MLKNYLRTACRHLWRNKRYSAINVAGLAIGITCLLLAVLYTKDEHSFDDFHQQNIYRITTTVNGQTTGGTGQVQGPAFKAQVPEVLRYARVMGGDIYGDLIANGKALKQQILFVDDDFFKIFSFELLEGSALTGTGSVVVTESTARKYFNSTDVVGKQIEMDADPSARKLGKPLVIAGVVKDPPRNSSIRFDVLLPFKFLQLSFEDESWSSYYLGTFVVLHPEADLHAVTTKFNSIHAGPKVSYGLQRMTDMHLHPLYTSGGSREGGVINGSNPVFSYIFLGIAGFILLMAAINFINISIAVSLRRAKEVGVRKVTGGSSMQIIIQFMLESALLCILAFSLAMLLTQFTLPVFNQLSGKNILWQEALDGQLLRYCILMLLFVVVLTGTYPAYVLSGFQPVKVLYNRQRVGGRNMLGRGLIVLQFSLAVFFIIASLLFFRQMDYVRTKDLGYNPHQVIRSYVDGARDVKKVEQLIKDELVKEPGIDVVSLGGERSGTTPVKVQGREMEAVHRVIDEHYLSALDITIKEGQNLPASNSVMVNEAFVKAAGLKDPVGTLIQVNEYFDKEPKVIAGVVKDFHFGSLRERIAPMVLFKSDWYGGAIWIKFDKARQQQVIAAFEKIYKKILPNTVFTYHFQDELNAKEYEQEQRWNRIVGFATLLSILICCSGLFGLAHISMHQRVKEIGIRKVLGAGVAGIVAICSKDFLKPVLIAFLMAAPVAGVVMQRWLENFAYRVELSWWIFAIAGIFALLIAGMTVVSQVLKAALANPVKSLRMD